MRDLTRDEIAIVFLDGLENLEYKHKKTLISLGGSPSAIFEDNGLIEAYFNKIGKAQLGKNIMQAVRDERFVEDTVGKALKGADDVVTVASSDYPISLLNIPTPPLALYARGNLELLKLEKIAIVGSRKTTSIYLKKVEEISKNLSESGIAVVTGIADGADSSAIKGAMQSGNVISVFAGEVGRVYPQSSNDLANKIVSLGGLLLSEYPAGTIPRVYSYPVRNRIIAGLSKGTLIASGNENSGTRYTASYATDFGRDVYCLPYGLGNGGEICKRLIKSGAVMVESAREIAEYSGLNLKEEKEEDLNLSEVEKSLYKLINEGITDTDEIAERLDVPIFEIISALGMLELKGLILKDGFGAYGAIK